LRLRTFGSVTVVCRLPFDGLLVTFSLRGLHTHFTVVCCYGYIVTGLVTFPLRLRLRLPVTGCWFTFTFTHGYVWLPRTFGLLRLHVCVTHTGFVRSTGLVTVTHTVAFVTLRLVRLRLLRSVAAHTFAVTLHVWFTYTLYGSRLHLGRLRLPRWPTFYVRLPAVTVCYVYVYVRVVYGYVYRFIYVCRWLRYAFTRLPRLRLRTFTQVTFVTRFTHTVLHTPAVGYVQLRCVTVAHVTRLVTRLPHVHTHGYILHYPHVRCYHTLRTLRWLGYGCYRSHRLRFARVTHGWLRLFRYRWVVHWLRYHVCAVGYGSVCGCYRSTHLVGYVLRFWLRLLYAFYTRLHTLRLRYRLRLVTVVTRCYAFYGCGSTRLRLHTPRLRSFTFTFTGYGYVYHTHTRSVGSVPTRVGLRLRWLRLVGSRFTHCVYVDTHTPRWLRVYGCLYYVGWLRLHTVVTVYCYVVTFTRSGWLVGYAFWFGLFYGSRLPAVTHTFGLLTRLLHVYVPHYVCGWLRLLIYGSLPVLPRLRTPLHTHTFSLVPATTRVTVTVGFGCWRVGFVHIWLFTTTFTVVHVYYHGYTFTARFAFTLHRLRFAFTLHVTLRFTVGYVTFTRLRCWFVHIHVLRLRYVPVDFYVYVYHGWLFTRWVTFYRLPHGYVLRWLVWRWIRVRLHTFTHVTFHTVYGLPFARFTPHFCGYDYAHVRLRLRLVYVVAFYVVYGYRTLHVGCLVTRLRLITLTITFTFTRLRLRIYVTVTVTVVYVVWYAHVYTHTRLLRCYLQLVWLRLRLFAVFTLVGLVAVVYVLR